MSRKRTIQLFFILISGVLLVACGSSTSAPTPTTITPPQAALTSPPTSASPAPSPAPAASSAASPSPVITASPAAAIASPSPAAAAYAIPPSPAMRPVSLDPSTTALLVLDLSTRCDDPAQNCNKLVPVLRPFVDRARASGVFTMFTVSATGQEVGPSDVWQGFAPRPGDLVLAPDSFNKFEDQRFGDELAQRGIQTLIITGSSTNVAVLYTATFGARDYLYSVVLPEDGMNATTQYEQDYALYQLTRLPQVAANFTFTTLAGITFPTPT